MTVKALIFCKVKHKAMVQVLEKFRQFPEIKKVFSLTGEFDVLAEIEVNTSEELYDSFSKKIDPIPGIIKTNTHVIMKEWEK